MTTHSAKMIEDSMSPDGVRLPTMELRYPRCIHAEFMTHRVLSRNASSSRAIPVKRLIQDVLDDPFIPVSWGKNQKGMQAGEDCDAPVILRDDLPRFTNKGAWLSARDSAVRYARAFDAAGYHKQIVNRLLEPFAHINVVVTSTDWDNFLALRDHPDAEPHMQLLAKEIRKCLDNSWPKTLRMGEWHLPYVEAHERDQDIETLLKISAARCARVSYKTHEGKTPTVEEDLKLFDQLTAGVLHASPLEHQATPDRLRPEPYPPFERRWLQPEKHGNLLGWVQYRKLFEKENAESEFLKSLRSAALKGARPLFCEDRARARDLETEGASAV